MDKPRRRAQHLQLVHSEPALSQPQQPPHRTAISHLARMLGLGVLAVLIWTRSSDMPQRRDVPESSFAASVAERPALEAAPTVTQSFPGGTSATLRHISRVLAFDAVLVPPREGPKGASAGQLIEPDTAVSPRSRVAFRLYNRTPQAAYFMLFGVDAQQSITWLYPAAIPTTQINRSLPLAPVPVVELPEPLPLPASLEQFSLVGVFTDAPVSTEEVKQAWLQGGAMMVQGLLHAQVQTLLLKTHQP